MYYYVLQKKMQYSEVTYEYNAIDPKTKLKIGVLFIRERDNVNGEIVKLAIIFMKGLIFSIEVACNHTTILNWDSDIYLFSDKKNEYINSKQENKKSRYVVLNRYRTYSDAPDPVGVIAEDHENFEVFTSLLTRALYYLRFPLLRDDFINRVWMGKSNLSNKHSDAIVIGSFKKAYKRLQLGQYAVYDKILSAYIRKKTAVRKIQRALLLSYFNPEYAICRKRLLREFGLLQNILSF